MDRGSTTPSLRDRPQHPGDSDALSLGGGCSRLYVDARDHTGKGHPLARRRLGARAREREATTGAIHVDARGNTGNRDPLARRAARCTRARERGSD